MKGRNGSVKTKAKFLGLAVVLVALAVLVNVLALSTATVNSGLTIDVVNTSSALVALSAPITPDPDVTVSTATGILQLTVADGVQPDSEYTFSPVFTITNNSAAGITVDLTGSSTPAGMTLSFTEAGTANAMTAYALAAGASVSVAMNVASTSATALGNYTVTVQLDATSP